MNKLLLLLFFALATNYAFAADEPRTGRHIFNYDIQLVPCDFNGKAIAGATAVTIPAETKFTIRNIILSESTPTDYIIRINRFISSKSDASTIGVATANKNTALVTNAEGVDLYFSLSIALYAANAERLMNKGNFTVGAATTLIKIRPGKKDPDDDGYTIYSEFGNDFNIGVSAGWKINPNRRLPVSHSIVGGLSFSSIKVTPYTTKKFLASEATQSCLTFSLGYIFEYNKFQVSAFSGIDVMSGEVGRHWIYKNRPWLGLGLGFQIFRADGQSSNTTAPR